MQEACKSFKARVCKERSRSCKSILAGMQRPNFVTKCEACRKRIISTETLNDVYDGQVWKDFMDPNGIAVLSLPYNFTISMNIDWFQLFKQHIFYGSHLHSNPKPAL